MTFATENQHLHNADTLAWRASGGVPMKHDLVHGRW